MINILYFLYIIYYIKTEFIIIIIFNLNLINNKIKK